MGQTLKVPSIIGSISAFVVTRAEGLLATIVTTKPKTDISGQNLKPPAPKKPSMTEEFMQDWAYIAPFIRHPIITLQVALVPVSKRQDQYRMLLQDTTPKSFRDRVLDAINMNTVKTGEQDGLTRFFGYVAKFLAPKVPSDNIMALTVGVNPGGVKALVNGAAKFFGEWAEIRRKRHAAEILDIVSNPDRRTVTMFKNTKFKDYAKNLTDLNVTQNLLIDSFRSAGKDTLEAILEKNIGTALTRQEKNRINHIISHRDDLSKEAKATFLNAVKTLPQAAGADDCSAGGTTVRPKEPMKEEKEIPVFSKDAQLATMGYMEDHLNYNIETGLELQAFVEKTKQGDVAIAIDKTLNILTELGQETAFRKALEASQKAIKQQRALDAIEAERAAKKAAKEAALNQR